MRARTVMLILLAVNVLWAAAFLGYRQSSRLTLVSRPNDPLLPRSSASNPAAFTAPAIQVTQVTLVATQANVPPPLLPSPRQYGWQDVTNEIYPHYIAGLRAAGCPEKQVRAIAISDVNELFDQRRLDQAIKTDAQWWKSETFLGVLPMQNPGATDFDGQRRELLTKLLGDDWNQGIRLPSLNATVVNLSGPVLGALPAETWSAVQEICARSVERHQAYVDSRGDSGVGVDNTELARLREQTRSELSKVLGTEQLEEFLLRYSQNSSKLRQDMAGIELTPDEFRKLFRTIDPMEHRMQVDYGGLDALSAKQREQLESLRDRAMKETLAPERYVQYMASKDPLYKQAQILASQSGLNAQAIQPLHDLQKSLDSKRTKIAESKTMTNDQKNQALQSLVVEHQQVLQRILTDSKYRQ